MPLTAKEVKIVVLSALVIVIALIFGLFFLEIRVRNLERERDQVRSDLCVILDRHGVDSLGPEDRRLCEF